MAKYKPQGFADSMSYDTMDEAIEAAKRQATPGNTRIIYAITEVAVLDTRTVTQHNVTYLNGAK